MVTANMTVLADRFAVEVMDDLADRIGFEIPGTWDDAKAAAVLAIHQEIQGIPRATRPDLATYVADRRRWAAELAREKSRPSWTR